MTLNIACKTCPATFELPCTSAEHGLQIARIKGWHYVRDHGVQDDGTVIASGVCDSCYELANFWRNQ